MDNENLIDDLFEDDLFFSDSNIETPENIVLKETPDNETSENITDNVTPNIEDSQANEEEINIDYDHTDEPAANATEEDIDILELVDETEPEIVNIEEDSVDDADYDDDPVETMPDEEFDKILKELRLTMDDSISVKQEPLIEMTAEEKIQTNIDLARERIKLERDELEYEREKFARYKAEYETMKKLSEESFQAEKKEFERRKQIEIKKIYLEAREKISSYKTYEEFIEEYKKILDVSE